MDAKTNGALEVLKRIGQYVPNEEFAAYIEAREAVEELVEAMRGLIDIASYMDTIEYAAEYEAARGALARFAPR